MIRSVQIDGYRGLSHFEMSGLGRINLIVGKDNSRKTSALEALHLLSSAGDVQALWQICGRRGSGSLRYVTHDLDNLMSLPS